MCSNHGLAVEQTTSFPNPGQDYYRGPLSLDQRYIPRPASTYLLRVRGNALRSRGIVDDDLVLVDRSLTARPGCIVIVIIDGEHRMGQLTTLDGYAHLSTDIGGVPLREEDQAWGVVTTAIHHLLQGPP